MARRRLGVFAVVMAMATACFVPTVGAEPAAAASGWVSVRAMLSKLPVRSESSGRDYSASAFGPWLHHSSCTDVVTDVLSKEVDKARWTADECRLESGRWWSAWSSAKSLTLAQVRVAHAVPLKEAWTSGAVKWSDRRRAAFKNDTTGLHSLVVVSSKAEVARGAKEPSAWLPPLKAERCNYVSAWIETKSRWRLSVDRAEKRALTKLLDGPLCKDSSGKVPRSPKPDVAALGTDVLPTPVASPTTPVPTATASAPAVLSTFPAFTSFSATGEGSRTVWLPAGATAASVSITTSENFDRTFLASTVDGSGQTRELVASAFGDYRGVTAYGLWGDRSAQGLKVTATGRWTVTVAPLASMPELTAATGSAISSRVFVYSGRSWPVTFTYPGSANFAVSQFTAPGTGRLLVNEIGKSSRTVTLAAGPSVVLVESSPPHDGVYDLWTTSGLPR